MGFLDDLIKGKSGQKAANEAAASSSAFTNAGYGQQLEALTKGYGSAQSRIDPYAKQAQSGFDLYADSVGVNGADGYGRAKTAFDTDPFRVGQQDATDRAIQSMFRRYNPSGQTGTQMAAVGRVGSDIYGQQVDGFRSRLAGLGSQGVQIAGQQAGWDINQGQEVGANALGRNNQLGSIEANRIQGVQAAKTQGQNNLMSGIGAIAGIAAAPFTGGASLGLTASSLGKMGGGGGGGGNPLMAGMQSMGSGWMQPGGSAAGNWINGAPTSYGSSWTPWVR